MTTEPDYHCDFCNRDVVAESEVDTTGCMRCPHCGVTDRDYQWEFGFDEPWLMAIDKKNVSGPPGP
jgi:DNA-directed RNA polymerase subunit RPC12/RpoP